jgi:hypothetical protein
MAQNFDPLKSAQPCGCDEAADWVCEQHQHWFVKGVCTWCELPKWVFGPDSDDAGLCEDCWLGMN